jgi:hypothetical protein
MNYKDIQINKQYLWLNKYIVTVVHKKNPAEISVIADDPVYGWQVPAITLNEKPKLRAR